MLNVGNEVARGMRDAIYFKMRSKYGGGRFNLPLTEGKLYIIGYDIIIDKENFNRLHVVFNNNCAILFTNKSRDDGKRHIEYSNPNCEEQIVSFIENKCGRKD